VRVVSSENGLTFSGVVLAIIVRVASMENKVRMGRLAFGTAGVVRKEGKRENELLPTQSLHLVGESVEDGQVREHVGGIPAGSTSEL